MAKPTAKRTVERNADAAKSGRAAEKVVKGSVDVMIESGNASKTAIQELTEAYQELATRNAKNLTAAVRALAEVKSPAEFVELQQRLIREGVEAAVSDSRHITQLTTAVFTTAFEPIKKRIESAQNTTQS